MTMSDGVDQPSFVFVVTRQPCSLSFSLPEPSDPPSSRWAGSTSTHVDLSVTVMVLGCVPFEGHVSVTRRDDGLSW
jgi:hypothetical protein